MGSHADPRFTDADAEVIKHKVRKIIGRYGLNRSDEPDLQQDLAMHISVRMAQHDPSRGARSTFVDRVITNKIASIIEHRTAQKRDRRRETTLEAVDEDAVADRADDQQVLDRQNDVREAVARLPLELQDFARRLQTQSEAEIIRATGLTRGQVRQRISAIRHYLCAAGLKPEGAK